MSLQKELIVMEVELYRESMETEVCRLAGIRVQGMPERSLCPTKNPLNEERDNATHQRAHIQQVASHKDRNYIFFPL